METPTICIFVLVKLIDHLHETASNDGLQYVITEGLGRKMWRGRRKPIFTLQSMKSKMNREAVMFCRQILDKHKLY